MFTWNPGPLWRTGWGLPNWVFEIRICSFLTVPPWPMNVLAATLTRSERPILFNFTFAALMQLRFLQGPRKVTNILVKVTGVPGEIRIQRFRNKSRVLPLEHSIPCSNRCALLNSQLTFFCCSQTSALVLWNVPLRGTSNKAILRVPVGSVICGSRNIPNILRGTSTFLWLHLQT